MKKYLVIAMVGAVAALGTGCSDDSDNGGTGGTAGSGGSGGTAGTGATGGGGGNVVDLCADAGGSGQVLIESEEITEDTLLTADCTYVLTRQVYVIGSTLEIEPGVEIGGDNGSALIITTSGMIDAEGTAEAPIVFTSSRPSGERLTGDWGGVVMLGLARLSWGNAECDGTQGECVANIEGLPDSETRGRFGGDDDSHNCGTLRYARIEYAGFRFGMDNELNALTVGGCGDTTTLEYIQVHRGLDDGFEFFGGTTNLTYGLCTGTGDDCFDTDQGYRGTIMNFIAHHFAGSSDDPRGVESDNFSSNNDVEPRSNPVMMYGTIVANTDSTTQQGVVTRRGTYAVLDGVVVGWYERAGFDMRDASWETGWTGVDGPFVVKNSCFTSNNPNWPPLGTDCEDENMAMGDCNDPDDVPADETFDEETELAVGALANQELTPAELGLTEADFEGAANGDTPDYAIDMEGSGCMGAFAPDGTDWTEGWTAYPVN
ncbi:MAG: hypothetical protein AAGF92_24035 [Myxococcota bacterium]